jgi:hypothetical protein
MTLLCIATQLVLVYIIYTYIKVTGIKCLVGIATGYGLDDGGAGVRVPVGLRIFFSPLSPDRLWGPPNLLSNGYRGLFPGG